MSCSEPCSCTDDPAGAADPATGGTPFTRVRFNDGMLLSAADLRVEQNAHLWRDRLHQALLHGAGTVWGLGVRRSADGRQLQVEAGLAVDPRGRNLLVSNTLCLDVGALDAATVGAFPAAPTEGRRRAWVVLSHAACARDPAPALRPACAEAPPSPAWSRQVDSVRVDLVAEPPAEPIALLRALLERHGAAPERGPGRWLGAAPTATERRALLLELLIGPALPGDRDRSLLAGLWSDETPVPLLLAEVELGVVDGRHAVVADPDNTGRALLPGVQLLAELLYGVPLAGAVGGAPTAVVVEGLRVGGGQAEVALSAPLEPASVTPDAVSLLTFDGAAWQVVPVTVALAGSTLSIVPGAAPTAGQPVQLVLRGVGAHALVGVGGLPFAGEPSPTPLPLARDLVLVASWS